MSEDIAENGDNIIRENYSSKDGKQEKPEILTIEVYDKDASQEDAELIHKESTTLSGDEYVTVYAPSEEVKKYEENIVSDMGKITNAAVRYYTFLNEGQKENVELKLDYEYKFKEALKEYEQEKINEKSSNDLEIEP